MDKITDNLDGDLQGSKKFQPPDETLPPLAQLMQQSQISTTDVSNAKNTWIQDCPDDEFLNIIDAQ